MSGIAGIIRFGGQPVAASEVQRLTGRMSYRGPDGISHWTAPGIALGHCLLRTTEEAQHERQPLQNDDGSVAIVFDGWLQNWRELRQRLLSHGVHLRTVADSELVLRAYETWGHDCPKHIHGDFAFVVWNARKQEAVCVRDRIGMRPFHYHHARASGFYFASDPDPLIWHSSVPAVLDEGRLADAIVGEIEGFDLTSTFHSDILRLPPAHMLVVTADGAKLSRYWSFDVPEVLRLKSDAEYVEAFQSVFGEAVACRRRGAATTAFMVSGGLDSSSAAAMARWSDRDGSGPPVRTVSAVGPDSGSCVETQAAYAVGGMDGFDPSYVGFHQLDGLMPKLVEQLLSPFSPFDRHMSLVQAVYLTATERGARAVIDGVGSDLVLNDGGSLAYLLQNGRLREAAREAAAIQAFWGRGRSAATRLYQAAKIAFVPDSMRPWIRTMKNVVRSGQPLWSQSLIDPEFARRVSLDERMRQWRSTALYRPGSPARRAVTVFHVHNVAARERYERVAARVGIESRDPYFDVRMIDFCLSLPVEQTMRNGWTKYILRQSMAGKLPEAVQWRTGRRHLGWEFTSRVLDASRPALEDVLRTDMTWLAPYVDGQRLERLLNDFRSGADMSKQRLHSVYSVALLARWGAVRYAAQRSGEYRGENAVNKPLVAMGGEFARRFA